MQTATLMNASGVLVGVTMLKTNVSVIKNHLVWLKGMGTTPEIVAQLERVIQHIDIMSISLEEAHDVVSKTIFNLTQQLDQGTTNV